MNGDWHPWRYMAERFPHFIVSIGHELPPGVRGMIRGNRIWLCRTLDQAGRRTTLSHEIGHLETGMPIYPRGHVYSRREELAMDILAARRLMPLPKLIDELKWSRHPEELAEAMWTTPRMVRCRLENLDPIEVAELEHHLEGDWI